MLACLCLHANLAAHLVGGISGGDGAALALGGASRHPGMALATGVVLSPNEAPLIAAALVLATTINAAVSTSCLRSAMARHKRTLAYFGGRRVSG